MRLALAILVALTVAGCAALKPPPGPPPTAKTPLSLRAKAVVTLDSEKKIKGRAYITALAPASFRIEILSPFGTPVAVMLSDGDTLSVLKDGNVETFPWADERLPYAFTAPELVSALVGRAPSGADTPPGQDNPVTSVTDTGPPAVYNLTRDNSGNVTEVEKLRDGQRVLVVLFSDFKTVDGFVLPHKITVRETGRSLEVRYTGVKVDPELPEDIFRFKNGVFKAK